MAATAQVVGTPLTDGALVELRDRRVEATGLDVQVTDVIETPADLPPPPRILGLGLGRLLPDRQGLLVLGLGLRWLARLRQQDAECHQRT